ncbi:hypothetical protein [Chitinilyticum litopenaei]|uniref:hypothetical protein n=1 Tax=Chitinilyticum litopenaei TaxID=1121276 RepID=UPI0003F69803|nr:hypothetical protein [Chitinilyticum litopenaei]
MTIFKRIAFPDTLSGALPAIDWSRAIALVGGLLLVLLLARLVWLWALPQPAGTLRAPLPPRTIELRSDWFGGAAAMVSAAQAAPATTSATAALELRAIVSGPGAFALALRDGRAVVLRVGDNDGVQVSAIDRDTVTLASGATLRLRTAADASAAPLPESAAPAASATGSAPQLAPRTIARAELLATLGDINISDWNSWLGVASPGLRLQKPNRLLASLGLQQGDILDSVNDRPLTVPADISLLIQSVTNSPQTRLQLRRDGQAYGLLIQSN